MICDLKMAAKWDDVCKANMRYCNEPNTKLGIIVTLLNSKLIDFVESQVVNSLYLDELFTTMNGMTI